MRGPHPKDHELFSGEEFARIREAAADLRYLLGRGYAQPGALKLAGDRFQLTSRQRLLLFRAVSDPRVAADVRGRRAACGEVRGRRLHVDGHNVLITLETAIAGGLLIRCDDGFVRDIAARHGAYRQSENTERALAIVRSGFVELEPARVHWYLDRPLPFSGLLAQRLREIYGSDCPVALVDSADGAIKDAIAGEGGAIVATGDSAVLRTAPRAFDLVGHLVERFVPGAWLVDVAGDAGLGARD